MYDFGFQKYTMQNTEGFPVLHGTSHFPPSYLMPFGGGEGNWKPYIELTVGNELEKTLQLDEAGVQCYPTGSKHMVNEKRW